MGPDNRQEAGAYAWPVARADEALECLARRSGLASVGQGSSEDNARGERVGGLDRAALGRWIEEVAERFGLEVEAAETPHSEAESLVRGCGPALLSLPKALDGSDGLLLVLGRRRRHIRLLGPDLRGHQVPAERVTAWLCEALEAPQRPWVEGLLARLDVSGQRAQRVRVSLLRERLRRARVGGCWLLRLPPGASFWQQMRDAGLPWQMGRFLVFYAASYSLMLLSWWMLGRGALAGHLSQDWLLAWALVLLSLVLPQQASIWAQARLAAGAGTLLKRRLLQGALKLEPDEIRHQGAGQLLGRVIESEAMQTHALLGGFLAALGGVELLISAWVLAQGAAGWWHVGLLAVWLAATLTLGWRFFVLRRRWTEDRLEMTNDLVESLVGHRTRLAQERQESWHQREDRLLERYLTSSRTMDSQRTWLVVSSFAWVSVGIVGLLPAFVLGQGSTATLALAVGGILLASRAFNKLSRGFTHLTGAWISWRQAAPIFRAAARAQPGAAAGRVELPSRQAETPEATPEPSTPEPSTPEPVTPEPLLEAQDLVYRYRDRARPVLDGCNVRIHRGDRILLEGPSGGGKSTLAAILTRLRPPDSGLLLLGGLDRHTVGPDVWRQHIVSAPQFHENHVFTETFAFNLLMGRGWPPSPKDMAEATAVCEELGLGELLERMPAGLLQVVGETGWQLSHGERSRLFMARALLQGTEIVILDESFAALDPENLQRALHSALKRAPTLMVIAHP